MSPEDDRGEAWRRSEGSCNGPVNDRGLVARKTRRCRRGFGDGLNQRDLCPTFAVRLSGADANANLGLVNV